MTFFFLELLKLVKLRDAIDETYSNFSNVFVWNCHGQGEKEKWIQWKCNYMDLYFPEQPP